MLKAFFASRKWVVGSSYILGVFISDWIKHPLDRDTVMWTALVVIILIGGQHIQEAVAKRIAGVAA